jgi:hypothetical protein
MAVLVAALVFLTEINEEFAEASWLVTGDTAESLVTGDTTESVPLVEVPLVWTFCLPRERNSRMRPLLVPKGFWATIWK